MNPHTPHPDEGRSAADGQDTGRQDTGRQDTDRQDPDSSGNGRPDAGLPDTGPNSAGQTQAPPRLYATGDPDGPYAPPPHYGGTPTPAGPPQGGSVPGPQGQNFFDWIRGQGITRGRDRWIGGVASGIAHRLGIDPLIIRGVLIVLTVFAGLGVLAYGLAWALLPEPDGRIHVQEAAAGRWTAGMTGALITTVLGFPSLGAGVWGWDRYGFGAFVWTVFWVGGAIYVVYYLTQRNKSRNEAAPKTSRYESGSPAGTAAFAGTGGTVQPSTVQPSTVQPPAATDFPHDGGPEYPGPVNDSEASPAGPGWGPGAPVAPTPPGSVPPGGYFPEPGPVPPRPAPRNPGPGTPAVAITVGAALLVGGGIKALDAANVISLGDAGNALVWAVAAAILGLGILIAGLRGRTSGILSFFAVVALLIGGVFSVIPHGDRFRLQNADWSPASIEQARGGFEITGGAGTADLSKVALDPPLRTDVVIPIDATASNLTVVIPATVPVQIQADMTMGNLHEGTRDHGGVTNLNSDYNTNQPGARMVVRISGTLSNVTIKEGN